MTPEIHITAEPIDEHRCKFVVSEPLQPGRGAAVHRGEEAKGSPLAEAIYGIPASRSAS